MNFLLNPPLLVFRDRIKKLEEKQKQPDTIQHKQMTNLIEKATSTEWGIKYDYKSIHSYTDFKNRIPVHSYNDLKPYITRMINGEKDVLWPGLTEWFAQSSGTTNDKSKYIPVTKDILKDCHYQGGFDVIALYLRNHPESHFFFKKSLVLGGSHSPSSLNNNAHCGDLSAVLLQNLNPLVNLLRVPSKEIILMDEWEAKIKAIVDHVYNKDVVSLSGVPSWMLVLIKAVIKKTGKEFLSEIWPNLEVFFHGGISFSPYRKTYKELIGKEDMCYMETYNASEGFFGIQDDPLTEDMLLMQDYGIFYEFIPLEDWESEDPKTYKLDEVEIGKNYAMVISTSGGLWRYKIGDTVRFTSLHPHKIIISGRTKHFINAFGEELMVANADKALALTCKETHAKVREYTAAPEFMLGKAQGRHEWLIEFEKAPLSIKDFATRLDLHLQELNSDYEAKRYKDISLQPLQIIVGQTDLFYDWLKQKGKLGGQHKIPRLSNDRTYLDEMIALQQ